MSQFGFCLWRADSLPWNLVNFLDEAAERLLLRKIGGGYIFMHRLLLDYFVRDTIFRRSIRSISVAPETR